MCLFQIWFPWCVCPEVGLLGHMAVESVLMRWMKLEFMHSLRKTSQIKSEVLCLQISLSGGQTSFQLLESSLPHQSKDSKHHRTYIADFCNIDYYNEQFLQDLYKKKT